MKRLAALLMLACVPVMAGASADCIPATPLPLLARIGPGEVHAALLVGGSMPALRVVDAASGATLWSADAAAGASQRFAAMTAAFAGSFAALDTDGDGLPDRVYAGDLAGRLWRFDLHQGAAADHWASGGIFADFSNELGRGFLAPPDVSLMAAAGAAPWFDIAVGTAAPGHAGADNRFYVLRDATPFTAWSDQQYRDWQPLREADLLHVTTAEPAADAVMDAGWFVELGSGDVLTASLTVAGRVVFAVAEAGAGVLGCRSAFSLATLSLATTKLPTVAAGNWRRMLDGEQPLTTSFMLAVAADSGVATARCTFGDQHLADCDVDLRPHRTWWRREDAE